MSSDYVESLKKTAKACSKIDGPDKFHKATSTFFSDLYKNIASIDDVTSGNRTFLSKALEDSIIAGFSSVNILSARTSPRIMWRKNREDVFPKKFLDILVYSGDANDRAVAIEIKGRNFNAIAAAVMEFGVACKFGRCIKSKDFEISPCNTHFSVVLGDSTNKDRQYFAMHMSLFKELNIDADIHCLLLDKLVENNEYEKIHRTAYRFFKKHIQFLCNN